MLRLCKGIALLLFGLTTIFLGGQSVESERPLKVAVLGKGLPAALTTAFLREELGPSAELTVVTRHAQLNGKERLVSNKYGHIPEPVCIEAGGRLHQLLSQQLQLTPLEPTLQNFAVFDGQKTRFNLEGVSSIADHDSYKEAWPKLEHIVDACATKRAFLHQTLDDPEFCRWNASQFLKDTQLEDFATQSMADLLESYEIASTSTIATEIVGALTSEIFNQGLEINAAAACDALFQLFGKNKACYDMADLEARLFDHSGSISYLNTLAFSVRSEKGLMRVGVNRTATLGPFDAVLVADVHELNELYFVAQEQPMTDYRQWMEFVERYEYVVEGRWQADYFDEDEPEAALMIVPENVAAGFVSVRRLTKGEEKAPSTYLLKTEIPLQVTARQDMFGRRSQVLASFYPVPPSPDLDPAFMKEDWNINPFPVSGHAIHTATQLQWLSCAPDFLAIAAENAARTLVRVQKLGDHSSTNNQCGGDLPEPVVIKPRKTRRMPMPVPDERLAQKLKHMTSGFAQNQQQRQSKSSDEL